MSCDPSKSCSICDQQGLPILPLRYAVARRSGGADPDQRTGLQVSGDERTNPLEAPFGADSTDIPLPDDHAAYALRLLRSGYLYVFNEVRGKWQAFVVDNYGYLLEFDIHSKAPPDIDGAEPCQRMQSSAAGRCVMIPDAEKAGAVWLGFSDTAWTEAVWERNKKQAYRERHMQRVDVGAWASAGSAPAPQPHMDTLDKLDKLVAEFSLPAPSLSAEEQAAVDEEDAAAGAFDSRPLDEVQTLRSVTVIGKTYPAMDHSPHDYHNEQEYVEDVRAPAIRAAGRFVPAMVALKDPVGIAAELNELIKIRAEEWAEWPERKKKYESALHVGAMRQALEHGGELSESQSRKTAASITDFFMGMFGGTAYRRIVGRPGEVIQRAGKIDESELAEIHAEALEKYEKMYDEPARRQYLEQEYPAALAGFERSTLKPLNDAYLAWLKSEQFRQCFICNYDTNDCSSGVGYTGALYTVLLDATGRSAVCDFLEDCLCADPNVDDPDQATTEAILLRGMVYNQDELARQWNEAASAPYEPRGGWEAMAARLYRAFRKKLSGALTGPLETRLKNLSQYSYEFSGASLRRLQRVYDLATGELIATVVERRTLVMIGMLSKHESPNLKLVEVRTRVNRQQTTQILARAAAAMSGDRRAMLGQRGALHELFDPLSTEHLYYQGVLLVDETQVSRFNGTIPADQFDAQMRQNLNRLINRVEAGTHFVTALLAVWTLGSAWEAMRKEPGLKSTMGFAMGLGAIAGPLMEGTGAAVRSSQWGATKLARPIVGRIGTITTRAAMVGFAGKMIGVVGAVVGGVLAVHEGWQDRRISPLYAATMIVLGGGMILAGALMIFAASSPVGFVLALVIALIMFVVGFLKKDEIQKWLDQAIEFGHHKQGEFSSLELQFEAMQGIGRNETAEAGAQ